MAHIREPRAELVYISTCQRVDTVEFDKIRNEHQLTDFKITVYSACRIGYDHFANADKLCEPDGEDNFLCRPSFVNMKSTLH